MMPTTTPTGIPIVDCATCGYRHPTTREHCPVCGLATAFGHEHRGVLRAPFECTCGNPGRYPCEIHDCAGGPE